MDPHIFIALVGALINMFLSTFVPCLIKKTEQPFLSQVKIVFKTNRQVILTSSLIVAVTLYLALKVSSEIKPNFTELTGINFNSSYDEVNKPFVISNTDKMEIPSQLNNLVKLMNNRDRVRYY
jgi:hypothetical protein